MSETKRYRTKSAVVRPVTRERLGKGESNGQHLLSITCKFMITAITLKHELDIHGEAAGPIFVSMDDGNEMRLDAWMMYSEARHLATLVGVPLLEA